MSESSSPAPTATVVPVTAAVDSANISAEAPPTSPALITYADFQKVSLRVAQITAAERIEKSDKLVKLQVSLGEEQRQIVAGIAKHYSPEELVGRKIVVVANLAPAKLMGEKSEGMLLAASDDQGNLALLDVAPIITAGSIVK